MADEAPFAGGDSRWITPADLPREAASLRAAGFFLESMTCVDRIEKQQGFELIYTFNRYESPSRIAVRALAPAQSRVPSLTGVFPIAGWNEREIWEFFGLHFEGHPNLTWLLLPEDTDFHPLLKSFTAPPPSIYDDSINPSPLTNPPTL